MKGYFACPLASGRDRKTALTLVELIESRGHKVLDRHVIASEGRGKEEFCKNSGLPLNDFNPQNVRRQDLLWVIESEFMVLDYTYGSWGGGIEFDHATVVRELLGLKPIPILCLRQKDATPSWLVLGVDTLHFSKVRLKEYSVLYEAKKILSEFLDTL